MSGRELHCPGWALDIPAVSLVFCLCLFGNLVNLLVPKVLSFISLACSYNIVRKFLGRCCSPHGVALALRGVRQCCNCASICERNRKDFAQLLLAVSFLLIIQREGPKGQTYIGNVSDLIRHEK